MLAQERPKITPPALVMSAIAIAILVYAGRLSDLNFVELFQGTAPWWSTSPGIFRPPLPTGDLTAGYFGNRGYGHLGNAAVSHSGGSPGDSGIWQHLSAVGCSFPVATGSGPMRAINEVVFALIFIVAVGLGPFAGVLALFVHTAGILAKLFSEAIEAIEVVRWKAFGRQEQPSAGNYFLVSSPRWCPLWTSFTLYRFESNVRSASPCWELWSAGGGSAFPCPRAFAPLSIRKSAPIMIILIVRRWPSPPPFDTISAKLRQRLV